MTNFEDLFEYNDWANRAVIAAADELTPEQLAAPMPELGGSTFELLAHASHVESAFLAVLANDPSVRAERERDYNGIRETYRAVAERFGREIPALSDRLAERVHIPWWEREFAIEQVLLQVATHSVQHRAGICAGIARAGKKPPDLDYIIWLGEFR